MKKIVLGLLVLILAGFFARNALAMEYGQIGGKPANPDPGQPNSNSWFIYNLKGGESKEDAIIVMNLGDQPWDALIYAADSVSSSSGGFALRQYVEAKEQVGSWVKFYPDEKPSFSKKIFANNSIDKVCGLSSGELANKFQLKDSEVSTLTAWCKGKDSIEMNLKAGEKITIPFVISIPEKADIGEHTGGILIQKQNKEELQQAGGSKVMLTTRVGVRIYETVPGEVIKKLSYEDFSTSKNFREFFWPWDKDAWNKYGEYNVVSHVKNDGNVSVDFKEKITIKKGFSGFFKNEETVERDFQVLRSDNFSSVLAWKAPIFGSASFQREYSYVDDKGENIVVTMPMASRWFFAWYYLFLAILVIALAFGIYWLYRKNLKKKYGGVGWGEYKVAAGDTVAELASKVKIDWLVLAKTNRIKPPYLLTPGQVIKVPRGVSMAVKKAKKNSSSKPARKSTKNLKINNTVETIASFWDNKETKETSIVRSVSRKKTGATKRKSKAKVELSFVQLFVNHRLFVIGVLFVLGLVIFGSIFIVHQNIKRSAEIEAQLTNLIQTQAYPPADASKIKVQEKQESEDKAAAVEKSKDEIVIKILNGGTAPGTAGKVKDFLISKGYKDLEAKNAQSDNHAGNTIYFQSSVKNEATWIQQMLSNKYAQLDIEPAVEGEQLLGDIVIILGK